MLSSTSLKYFLRKFLYALPRKIKNIFTYFYGLDHDDFLNLFLLLWLLLALLTQQFVCVGTAQQKQARGGVWRREDAATCPTRRVLNVVSSTDPVQFG